MECAVVCAAGAGALDGVFAVAVAVFAFAVAMALAVAVVSVLLGYAWALALAVGVACVLGSVALVRVYRYGPTIEVFRRHRRARVVRRRAITTGQAMIEGGRIEVTPGMVLGKVKEESPCR